VILDAGYSLCIEKLVQNNRVIVGVSLMKQRTSIMDKPSFFLLPPCGGGERWGELIFIHPHPKLPPSRGKGLEGSIPAFPLRWGKRELV